DKRRGGGGECTPHPSGRVGGEAPIVFADILLVLEPLGVGLEFTRGDGPHIARPVRSADDVAGLAPVDVPSSVGFVFETVRLARKGLGERVPLIGFARAPFPPGAYLSQSGAPREVLHTN